MHHFIQIILLGIVEGITEFLPISSTGHLLIAEKFLEPQGDTFNIVIQFGAVLAVVLIYWKRLHELCVGFTKPENRDYVFKLFTAFVITAVGGLMAKHLHIDLPESIAPIAWALLIGGVIIIAIEFGLRNRSFIDEVTWQVAIVIGLAQIIAAVFPGSSRSACTIMSAMLLGLSRPAATEFSFILSIPTMFAASVYALWKQHDEMKAFTNAEGIDIALGFIVSGIVAFVAVKWLLGYVRSHTFIPFGIYRIVIGLWLLIAFVWGVSPALK